jgi:hypothetical protein
VKEGQAIREISREAENNEGEVNLKYGDAEGAKKNINFHFPKPRRAITSLLLMSLPKDLISANQPPLLARSLSNSNFL